MRFEVVQFAHQGTGLSTMAEMSGIGMIREEKFPEARRA